MNRALELKGHFMLDLKLDEHFSTHVSFGKSKKNMSALLELLILRNRRKREAIARVLCYFVLSG